MAGKVSVHLAGFHFLLWEQARDQGGSRVVEISTSQWADRLVCEPGTVSRVIKKMEQVGRIRCLQTGRRGGTAFSFEVYDPADFDTEAAT